MLQIISGTTLVLSTVLPLSTPDSTTIVSQPPLVMKEYKSPTMTHDPFEIYRDKEIQRIMDKILIDSIKRSIGND